MIELGTLGRAARDVTVIFCFRAVPFAGFAIVARDLGFLWKVPIVVAFGVVLLALHAWTSFSLSWFLGSYVYFALVCTAAPLAVRSLRGKAVTKGGVFAASATAFFVLPAIFSPEASRSAVLLIGWDMMLASYSYCVEVAKSAEPALRSDCWFFVLVNPSLVYSNRGDQISPPALDLSGLRRVVFGLVLLFASMAFLAPLTLHVRGDLDSLPLGAMAGLAAFGAIRFLVEYWRHAGLANLQIGMMRQLGYAIPERYRLPVVATNPTDFWRRWNTYVTGWMTRYVFWPLVFRFRSRRITTGVRGGVRGAYGFGVVATFAALGLLHDVSPYATGAGSVGRATVGFSVIGVMVVMWSGLAGGLSRALGLGRGSAQWRRRLSTVGAWLCFWSIVVGCSAWIWGST